MEKLPHYNFSWTVSHQNFGRGYGPVGRQTNTYLLVPIQSQMNPIHILPSYFFKLIGEILLEDYRPIVERKFARLTRELC
jgi:hypothetical protein